MKLDFAQLADAFAEEPDVVLAILFGSSKGGDVSPGSDVDIGVLLSPEPTPVQFFELYLRVTRRLEMLSEVDLVDLNRASSILAYEALCGRRLVVRDPDAVATFSSRVARQYEDDLLHASHYGI